MKNNLGRRNKMKDKINSILSEAKGKISDAVSEGELRDRVKSAACRQDTRNRTVKIRRHFRSFQLQLHPLLIDQVLHFIFRLIQKFSSMGFEVFEEDEITSEMYAFDKLNFPPNHPGPERPFQTLCSKYS